MTHDLAYIAKIAKRILPRKRQNDLPKLFLLSDIERKISFQEQVEKAPIGACVILRHYGDFSQILQIRQLKGIKFGVSINKNIRNLNKSLALHIPNKYIAKVKVWNLQNHLLTTSAHNLSEILKAKKAGLKNIMVSPVFKSESPSAKNLKPISTIKIAKLSHEFANLNFIGLGGINAKNIKRLQNTKLEAIAGVSFS